MGIQVDMRLVELLISRLHHDLVGPIGAVNNGMELLEDEDLGGSDDAIQLAANSARQAASILKYYRLAYGMAGSQVGGDIDGLRETVAGFLTVRKASLEWSVQVTPDGTPEGLGKLLLNMIVLAEEMLPRHGAVSVAVDNGSAGLEASVTVAGQGAALREDAKPGLAEHVEVDELTPRNVQGYFTRLLAQRLGSDLTIESPGTDRLRFSVALRA